MTEGAGPDAAESEGSPPGLLARQWPILVVLSGVLAGLAVASLLDAFRGGTLLIAGSVVLAAWLRALLPADRPGVLVVRSRAVDVVTLVVLGVAITVLALVVPPPSS